MQLTQGSEPLPFRQGLTEPDAGRSPLRSWLVRRRCHGVGLQPSVRPYEERTCFPPLLHRLPTLPGYRSQNRQSNCGYLGPFGAMKDGHGHRPRLAERTFLRHRSLA